MTNKLPFKQVIKEPINVPLMSEEENIYYHRKQHKFTIPQDKRDEYNKLDFTNNTEIKNYIDKSGW